MERRDQGGQQKKRGDFNREHIGANQRDADRLDADHRARGPREAACRGERAKFDREQQGKNRGAAASSPMFSIITTNTNSTMMAPA